MQFEYSPAKAGEPSLLALLWQIFMPLLFADLFSAMRASLRRRSNDEFDDGVAYGWQAWLHSFL